MKRSTITSKTPNLTTAQIGRLGELLVQAKLLEIGIDSAPTTTDAGIDLLALAPKGAIAIQVKTNLKPKPSGGKGRPAVDWWVELDRLNRVNLFAFVRYDTKEVWLMTPADVKHLARQKTGTRLHFYMYVERPLRGGSRSYHENFERYLFDRRSAHFGVAYLKG